MLSQNIILFLVVEIKKFTKKNLKIISKSLNQEQKKYNLKLSGGDTTNSNKVSFSITTIGFSKILLKEIMLN